MDVIFGLIWQIDYRDFVGKVENLESICCRGQHVGCCFEFFWRICRNLYLENLRASQIERIIDYQSIMSTHDDGYYESRRPIEDLGHWRNFRRFIWNPERRAFFDRTAKEWARVALFYLCFYGVLFALFALQLWIALDYIAGLEKPFLKHTSQFPEDFVASRRSLFHPPLIKFENPGVGFVPNIVRMSTTSPIIWLSPSHDNGKPENYIKPIEAFLNDYHRDTSNYDINCTSRKLPTAVRTKPCYFDVSTLGKCSQLPFGYELPYQPCVYIKFNKRFDWLPKYYNKTSELPESMPRELKAIVRTSDEAKVWISCNGAKNVDKEHIGEISYMPSPGFPVQFFPYSGHSRYLSPIVAIKFHNLTANRLVTVECHTWAKNIGDTFALDFQIVLFS